ncbi:MAG: polysaccharide pyruvyl transferase family protein [Oscillospiraceae bacterium]|nr:polysaccharide pyruvyl transferase family protein [Oscillospiraceae bacterium]
MKKVAVVSCYFQNNYGSMLQALATQEFLNLQKIPNETINIDGFKKEIHDAKLKYFKSRIFSADVIKDKLGFVRLTAAKKLNRKLGKNIALRHQKFDAFSAKRFHLSKTYASKAELGKQSENYSAFLVGSDQLWLPSNIAADYYTLNYVPEHVRKIAYATSFGVASLPEKQAEMAKKFLPRIDFLSVREKTGQKLIKELTGLEARLVCDPTLILTRMEWASLIENKRLIQEKYIFCYFLGNNQLSRECAKLLREKTGYKIVALQQMDMYIRSDENFADFAPYETDPADFVNLIRHASFVCTDSFHGTVFSLIHHKRFFSFRRFVKNSTMSTNNRLDSLLSILGLENRIINEPADFKTALSSQIDYEAVEEKLNDFRKDSITFLKESLEGLE